jgi:hypothetical protein
MEALKSYNTTNAMRHSGITPNFIRYSGVSGDYVCALRWIAARGRSIEPHPKYNSTAPLTISHTQALSRTKVAASD